jgi:hypothetical protein
VALGLFVFAWLGLADLATGGCDDSCDGSWWAEDAEAPEWDEQLWIARFGVAFTLLTAIAWLQRRRLLALPLGIVSAILFVGWYSIAHHARFGP